MAVFAYGFAFEDFFFIQLGLVTPLTYKPRASLCADRLVLARVSAKFLDCVFNPYEYLVTFVVIMSTVPSTNPDGYVRVTW